MHPISDRPFGPGTPSRWRYSHCENPKSTHRRKHALRRIWLASGEPQVGWGRVTTRAVTARADLPHGTVSYHFHGKQELLTEAALDAFEQAFPIEQLRSLATLSDLLDVFEPWLGEPDGVDPVVSRIGIEAMLESERNPVLRDRLADMLREFRAVVAQLARAAGAAGSPARGASPEAIATLLGAVDDGLFLHARLDPDLDAKGALEALHALLTRWYGAAPLNRTG